MALVINPADIDSALVERYTYKELDQGTREWWRRKLCQDAIDIVGIAHRNKHGKFICLRDVDAHRDELLQLFPLANLVLTATEMGPTNYAKTPQKMARNLLSVLLRSNGQMGARKTSNSKVNGCWRGCTDWQLLDP